MSGQPDRERALAAVAETGLNRMGWPGFTDKITDAMLEFAALELLRDLHAPWGAFGFKLEPCGCGACNKRRARAAELRAQKSVPV